MDRSTKRDSATQDELRSTRFPILVVDDDQAIRTILSSLLSTMGFQVALATNGHEALDLFAKKTFEFVLTDFQMPGMDGFTLASNIKSSSPKTPVIMITGSDERIVEERMRKGCVDRVIFKPFKLEDVYESVEVALTGRSNLTGRHSVETQKGE
jgi:CheY-like chemotaxis protein